MLLYPPLTIFSTKYSIFCCTRWQLCGTVHWDLRYFVADFLRDLVKHSLVIFWQICQGFFLTDFATGKVHNSLAKEWVFYCLQIFRIKPGLTSFLGSFCPSPIPPIPGQPCTLPGALDCPYEGFSDDRGLTGYCCCGHCGIGMTCAPDLTNESGLWQPKHSVLCPTEGCGSEGEWWRKNVKTIWSPS